MNNILKSSYRLESSVVISNVTVRYFYVTFLKDLVILMDQYCILVNWYFALWNFLCCCGILGTILKFSLLKDLSPK